MQKLTGAFISKVFHNNSDHITRGSGHYHALAQAITKRPELIDPNLAVLIAGAGYLDREVINDFDDVWDEAKSRPALKALLAARPDLAKLAIDTIAPTALSDNYRDWPVAFRALTIIAQNVPTQAQAAMNLVTPSLNHPRWLPIKETMNAIGEIAIAAPETMDEELMTKLIFAGESDEHDEVRDAANAALGKISKMIPQLVNEDFMGGIVNSLIMNYSLLSASDGTYKAISAIAADRPDLAATALGLAEKAFKNPEPDGKRTHQAAFYVIGNIAETCPSALNAPLLNHMLDYANLGTHPYPAVAAMMGALCTAFTSRPDLLDRNIVTKTALLGDRTPSGEIINSYADEAMQIVDNLRPDLSSSSLRPDYNLTRLLRILRNAGQSGSQAEL